MNQNLFRVGNLQQKSLIRVSNQQMQVKTQDNVEDEEIESPVLQKVIFENQQANKGRRMSIQLLTFAKKQNALKIPGNEFEEQVSHIMSSFITSQQCSGKRSQVLSINEFNGQESQPFFLSKINDNFKNKINRLLLQRIQNYISQLRDLMGNVTNLVKQQYQNSIMEFQKGIEIGIQEIMARNRAKTQQILPCSKCKSQQIKNKSLTQALQLNQSKIEKLLAENQHLNQSIFDLQQKVVGIDLEVQRRLKLQGTLPPDIIVIDAKATNTNSNIYLDNIKRLNDQIAALNAKCQHYQQICIQQDQLKRNLQSLKQNESNYLRKEAEFIEVIKRNQAQIDSNYSRQHELSLVEENWTKKITELKKKEAQLIEWEADLIKKTYQKEIRDKNNQNSPNMDNEGYYRRQSCDLLQKSEVMSLRSFGKIDGQNANSNANFNKIQEQKPNISPVFQTFKEEVSSPNGARGGKSMYYYNDRNEYNPIEHNNYQKYDKQDKRQYIRRKSPPIYNNNSYYRSRSRENIITSINNKYQTDRHHPKGNLSPTNRNQHNITHYQQNVSHQYLRLRNSPNHLREVSIHSNTSKSKKKFSNLKINNILHAYGAIPSSPRTNSPYSGLGHKLERLRTEMKKQMDYIK